MTITITLGIIAVTVIMHLIASSQPQLKSKMLFNAYDIKHRREWHRWFTNGFIHADLGHLLINMFVLYMFGQTVEAYLVQNTSNGSVYFIVIYVAAIFFASLRSYFKHQDNPKYNALGASGATSAMLFVYIIILPVSMFYDFIPAFLFGLLYLWYEHMQSKRGRSGIAHDAHFYGALFGLVVILVLVPESGPLCVEQIEAYITQKIGG